MRVQAIPLAGLIVAGAFLATTSEGASQEIRVSSWKAAEANVVFTPVRRPTVTLGAKRQRLVVADTRLGVSANYRNRGSFYTFTQWAQYTQNAKQHGEGSFWRPRGTTKVDGVRAQLRLERGEVGYYRLVNWERGGVEYTVSNQFGCTLSARVCRSYGFGTRVMPWKNLAKIARSLRPVS